MIKAIAPIDIPATKASAFPDAVIETWNNRIALNYCGGRAYVMQDDIISDLCAATGVSRDAVFANKWLDVEDIYREQGWSVVYDKPGYCESYAASFTFTPKNA